MSIFDPASTNTSEQTLSVTGFCNLVQDALRRGIGKVWVRGVVQRITEAKGHYYLELVERSGPGGISGTVTGQLDAVIFAQTYSLIGRQLRERGMDSLEAGLMVRVKGRPNIFVPRGKFNFVIEEIDLNATFEARLVERERIRELLIERGSYEQNRSLVPAPVIERIAIVGSSAGVVKEDFVGQLSASGFRFVVKLFDVSTTGDQASQEIARGIKAAERSDYDLIVLLRGGGSATELSPYESEAVVTAVAESALPVWCGIGHSSDRPLVNEVANQAFDVPLAVGAAIVDHNAAFLDELDDRVAVIVTLTRRAIKEEESELTGYGALLERRVNSKLSAELIEIGQWFKAGTYIERILSSEGRLLEVSANSLRSKARDKIAEEKTSLSNTRFDLQGRLRERVSIEMERLPGLDRVARSASLLISSHSKVLGDAEVIFASNDIDGVMARGYSIVESRKSGRRIYSAVDLPSVGRFWVHFADGKVAGRIDDVVGEIEDPNKGGTEGESGAID